MLLTALPFEITVKEPNPEDLKASMCCWEYLLTFAFADLLKVVEFARKTGDIATLSPVDLKVLALTLTLERQLNGGVHVKGVPGELRTITREAAGAPFQFNAASAPGSDASAAGAPSGAAGAGVGDESEHESEGSAEDTQEAQTAAAAASAFGGMRSVMRCVLKSDLIANVCR
jgi:hypothetical protein